MSEQASRASPLTTDLLASGLVAAFYLVVCGALVGSTGHLERLGDPSLLFQSFDAQQYRTYADWLISAGHANRPSEDTLALRPFLYPAFLCLYRGVGIAGFQLLQLALNAASTALLFHVLRRHVGLLLAMVGTLALMANLTFTFIAFHALTEPLTTVLLIAFVDWQWRFTADAEPRAAFASLLLGALLCCVKTVFVPYLVAWTVYLGLVRPGFRAMGWSTLRALSPLVLQLALTTTWLGHPSLGNAAVTNVRERFFPAVYGFAERGRFITYRDGLAERARTEHRALANQVQYIVEHPAAAVHAYATLLWDRNLQERSTFVKLPADEGHEGREDVVEGLTAFSKHLNEVWSWLHLIMCPVVMTTMFVSHGSRRRELLALYGLLACLILPAALVYFQGDRVVQIATPVWVVCYVLCIRALLEVRERRRPS